MDNSSIASLEDFESRHFYAEDLHFHSCVFCEPESALLLAETENLVLMRDKFPIAPGHLMITSKQHLGCLGELPREWLAELKELRQTVQNIYPSTNYISYEHGRAGHCVKLKDSSIACHHFHIHFLPSPANIHAELEERFQTHRIGDLSEVIDLFEKHGDYLFFQDINGRAQFYPADEEIEAHLLRTLICKKLSVPERADWEELEEFEAPSTPQAKKTLERAI